MGFGPFHCVSSDSVLAGVCGFCGRVVLERIFLPITSVFPCHCHSSGAARLFVRHRRSTAAGSIIKQYALKIGI